MLRVGFHFSEVGSRVVVLFAAMAMAVGVASAAYVSIDEFTEPTSTTYQANSGANSQNQWTDSGATIGAIGDVRDGSIGCESGEVVDTSNVTAAFAGGTLTVTGTGNATPSLYLAYDGTNEWGNDFDLETNPFNGVFADPVDLTGGGANDVITFRFTSVSGFGDGFNDFRMIIVQGFEASGEITSPEAITYAGDGTLGSGTPSYYYSYDAADEINAQLSDSTEEQFFHFPMSSLVNADSNSTTFNAVQAIQFHGCTTQTSFSYEIDYIRATPEPTTGVVLMLACGMLGLRRRRRC